MSLFKGKHLVTLGPAERGGGMPLEVGSLSPQDVVWVGDGGGPEAAP